MNELVAFGLDETGLVLIPGTEYKIREAALGPFLSLSDAAKREGFEIRVESSYRSFERQLSIWNRKATGKLTLLDSKGIPFKELPNDEDALMRAILLWSALPGASRHHFGSDLDVVDAAAVPDGYEVELTEEECRGMFAPFHEWLTSKIKAKESFGFDRVFVAGRGSIRPEPWHISHIPTARNLQKAFDPQRLRSIYERSDMALKNAVLTHFDELMKSTVFPYFL